jgi:hypothetical protein
MLLTTVTLISALACFGGASPWPFLITFNALAALLLAVFLGWSVHCIQVVPAKALAAAPLYALAKLPIYLAFLRKPQQQWVRTERDALRA